MPQQDYFEFNERLAVPSIDGTPVVMRLTGRLVRCGHPFLRWLKVVSTQQVAEAVSSFHDQIIRRLVSGEQSPFVLAWAWAAGKPAVSCFQRRLDFGLESLAGDKDFSLLINAANDRAGDSKLGVELHAVAFYIPEGLFVEHPTTLPEMGDLNAPRDPRAVAFEHNSVLAALRRLHETEKVMTLGTRVETHHGQHYTLNSTADSGGVSIAWKFDRHWNNPCCLLGFELDHPCGPGGFPEHSAEPFLRSYESGSRFIAIPPGAFRYFAFCLFGTVSLGSEAAAQRRFDPMSFRIDVPDVAHHLTRIEVLIKRLETAGRLTSSPAHLSRQQERIKRMVESLDERRSIKPVLLEYERDARKDIESGEFSSERRQELLDDLADVMGWARDEFLAQ